MSRQTTEETEQNLLDLQLNLRNELFIRPFELMNIENNGIQLCDGVIDYLGHMDIVQSNFKSHIANLEAQNKELREALQSVVDYEDRGRKTGEPRISDNWYNICKQALKEDNQDG